MSAFAATDARVLVVRDVGTPALAGLLSRYGLTLERIAEGGSIPGSFWGGAEAGLLGNRIIVRDDTPVHSALHEACHYICMTAERRCGLDTDAGGDYDEENAVCYLQILLADHLPGIGRQRMMQDMDTWGYSFRLGSAAAWFAHDADDAQAWLSSRAVIDAANHPTWRLRQD